MNMTITEIVVEGRPMWSVETDFFRLLVLPEQARILEIVSKATDRHFLAWWPANLDTPARVGGLGPLADAAPLTWRPVTPKPPGATDELLAFTAEGPSRLGWGVRYAIMGPQIGAELTCAWAGTEDEEATPPVARLRLGAEVLPGSGGAMPRAGTSFIHGRHKLLLFHHELYSDNMAVGEQPVAVETWCEPFQRFRYGPMPLDWIAAIDTTLREGFCVLPVNGLAEVGTHVQGLSCHMAVGDARLIGDQDRVLLGLAAIHDVFHVDWAARDRIFHLDTDRAVIWPGAHEIPLRILNLRSQPFHGRVELELHGTEDLGSGRDADHEASAQLDMTARLVWDPADIGPGETWSGRVRVPTPLRQELTIAPREEAWGSFYARGTVQALDASGTALGEEERFDIIRAISAEPGRACRELRALARSAADKLPPEARSKGALLQGLALRLERDQDHDARLFNERHREIRAQIDAVIASGPTPSRRFYSEADLRWMQEWAPRLDVAEVGAQVRERLAADPPWQMPVHREYGTGGVHEAAEAALHGALLHELTHDPEFAELAARRLAWFANFWNRFGTVRYETIHNSIVATPLILAADLLAAANRLPAETEARCLAYFTDIVEKIVRHQVQGTPLSNWKAMEFMAPALLGALHPYLPGAREWLHEAGATFDRLLGQGCFADGGFWEMSVGYHLTTMWALHWIGEALLRAAPDEGGRGVFATRTAGRRLSDMAQWAARLAVAPGLGPRFHDSARDLRTSVLMNVAKRCADAEAAGLVLAVGWQPTLEDLLVPLDPPTEEPVELRSFATEPSGKLVIRSGDVVFALNFGPHTGWHCHFNRLSFELFAGGVCLVPDSGTYQYEEALHFSWFKASVSHNTVTLGERNQLETGGELLAFEETGGEVRAAAAATTYPGIRHERRLTARADALSIHDLLTTAAGSEPQDESYVWRLNSFEEFAIEGNHATTEREGNRLRIEWEEEVEATAEQVPLMPDGPGDEPVEGWQLRLTQPAAASVAFAVTLSEK